MGLNVRLFYLPIFPGDNSGTMAANKRLTIILPREDYTALSALAAREERAPWQQAAWIVRMAVQDRRQSDGIVSLASPEDFHS